MLDNYLHNYLSIYRKKQSVSIIVLVWPKEEEEKRFVNMLSSPEKLKTSVYIFKENLNQCVAVLLLRVDKNLQFNKNIKGNVLMP